MQSTLIGGFYFLAFIVIAGLAVGLSIYSSIKEKRFMQQLAATCGYTYTASAPTGTATGNFFQNGGSLKNVISGTQNGMPVRIFNYSFDVGSGKDRHTAHFTIFETTYPYPLLHMIVTSDFWGVTTGGAFYRTSAMDKVELEGDFNKWFSVFVEKNLDTDVYEIFTPDIMTVFIDKAKGINFESSKQNLYLIVGGLISNQAKFDAFKQTNNFLNSTLATHLKETSSDVTDMEAEERG